MNVGYVSQHAEELTGDGTVLDAAQRATGLTPGKARALLGQFLFSGDDVHEARVTGSPAASCGGCRWPCS